MYMMFLLYFLSLLFPSSVLQTVNSGVKVRITSAGINYAKDVAFDILAQRLGDVHIPNQSGSEGPVDYYLSNLVLQNFKKPVSTITIDTKNKGLVWHGNSGTIAVHGNWRYKMSFVSDSGYFDASSTAFSFTAEVELASDSTGRPKLKAKSCSCNMGSVSISFHGGQSWIYNMFSGIVANSLKGQLQDQLCGLVTQAVNEDANNALAKIPVTIDIDSVFLLDYRFVSSPNFTAKYVDTFHKGEIYWKSSMAEAPFTPAPFPETNETSKMLYMWVSAYTANTIAYQAQQYKFLAYNLTQNDLPDSTKALLNTTCTSGICIGEIIPQIGEKYPNCTVQLALQSTTNPHISADKSGIMLTCAGQVVAYAIQQGKYATYLLTLNANMTADVNVSLNQEKIFANIEKSDIKLHVVNSNVGDIKDAALQFIVDSVLRVFVEPALNKIGNKGFPLPVTDDIHFVNSDVQIIKDALVIATDVHYGG